MLLNPLAEGQLEILALVSVLKLGNQIGFIYEAYTFAAKSIMSRRVRISTGLPESACGLEPG